MFSRDKDSQNVLHALLPGARIEKGKKITINVGTTNETVVFNIGGTRFETYRSTLNRLPFSPLADESFLKKHFRVEKGDYFFDREPDVFKAILNYLRTGELHLPAWLCGASVKNELSFWGIQEDEIEECCWTNYSSWTTTLEALNRLEKDMKGTLGHPRDPGKRPSTKWGRFCEKGWVVVNNPRSSTGAKIFGVLSMMFVMASIFSFCAETHEDFHIHVNKPAAHPLNVTNVSKSGYTTTFNNEATTDTKSTETIVYNHPSLFIIDIVCMSYFILEFVTRFILSPRKCRFFILPMTIVDIVALLPDIAEMSYRVKTSNFYSRDTISVIPILRVTRIFRIFRLMRHMPGLWILFYTLKASLKELLLMMVFLCVGMLVYASLIYFVDDRETFSSIPQGFWWALITMTTVGYGDMFPVTKLGYLVGSVTAVSGLLMIGFTVPILVSNFVLYYSHSQSSLAREETRMKRQKMLEAEARKRRPSLFERAFNVSLKPDGNIQMSSLVAMAGEATKSRNGKKESSTNNSEINKDSVNESLLKDTNCNSPKCR